MGYKKSANLIKSFSRGAEEYQQPEAISISLVYVLKVKAVTKTVTALRKNIVQ